MVSPRTARVCEHQRVANRYILATQPPLSGRGRKRFCRFPGLSSTTFPPFSDRFSLEPDYIKGDIEPNRVIGIPIALTEKGNDPQRHAPGMERRLGSETIQQGVFR